MKIFNFFFHILVCFFYLNSTQSQIKDTLFSDKQSNFSIQFGHQLPFGDLNNRFYSNFSLSGYYGLFLQKKYVFSLGASFIFRDKIKENNILDGIKTNTGYVIDGNGQLATISLFQRGFSCSALGGKNFYLTTSKDWMLTLQAGFGFLQHKILILDGDFEVPQLNNEYKKGYDRLSNGFMLHQMASLKYQPNNRSVMFYANIDAIQGFTKNRRSYNFDTMSKDTKSRLDALIGVHVGISIIFKKSTPDPYYFH